MLYLLSVYKSALLFFIGSLLLVVVIYKQSNELFKDNHSYFPKQKLLIHKTDDPLEAMPVLLPSVADRAAYEAIVRSPLFIEGRVVVPDEAENSLKVDEPVNFTLTGIVLGPERLCAIIADDKKNQHRLVEGEAISEWTIKRIQADKIILQNRNIIKELPLIQPNTAPKAIAPSAPMQTFDSFPGQFPNTSYQ